MWLEGFWLTGSVGLQGLQGSRGGEGLWGYVAERAMWLRGWWRCVAEEASGAVAEGLWGWGSEGWWGC